MGEGEATLDGSPEDNDEDLKVRCAITKRKENKKTKEKRNKTGKKGHLRGQDLQEGERQPKGMQEGTTTEGRQKMQETGKPKKDPRTWETI